MERFLTILSHYKSFFAWSFLINIFLLILNQEIFSIIVTKLFLILLALLFMNEIKPNKGRAIYKIIGITSFKLFSTLYILDTFITISFLIIIKEFI